MYSILHRLIESDGELKTLQRLSADERFLIEANDLAGLDYLESRPVKVCADSLTGDLDLARLREWCPSGRSDGYWSGRTGIASGTAI